MTTAALPRPRRIGRTALALIALLAMVALALLAGCSASHKSASSTSYGGTSFGSTADAAAGAAAQPSFAASSAAASAAAGGTVNGPAQSANGSTLTASLPGDQALIKTAALSLTVADVDKAAKRADDLATGMGGSVAQDNRNGTGSDETADLQLKVPPAQLSTALNTLKGLGVLVSQNTSTTDVTKQVADVDSRVKSMKAAISQLQAIYAQAKTVGEILSVESTLTSREADLESLEAQQSALASQTSQASISVHLSVAQKATLVAKKAHHYTGFTGGLHRGWHAFTTATTAVVIAIGAVLPFLAVVLVLGLIAWLLRRRVRQHTPAAPVPPVVEPAAQS